LKAKRRGAEVFWPNTANCLNANRRDRGHQEIGRQFQDSEQKWMIKLAQGRFTEEEISWKASQELRPQDVGTLLSSARNQPLKYRNRAIGILSYYTGIRVGHIATFLGVSHSSVDSWIERFRRQGSRKLLSPHTSGYAKVKDEQYKKAVFEILHAPPSCYDINRTTWRLEDIQSIMLRHDLPIGQSAISKIINDAGYRYRKAKRVLTSTDPEYREKIKGITRILSNLGPKENFFSIDEFGPFAVKIQGGKSLVLRGHAKTVPQWQQSKGSLVITGALELSTNQITHFYSATKNSAEMIKLLDILVEKYSNQERIYFSWDAASWHASKELYARVDEINNMSGKKFPQVALAPLPCSAQFLNVIESVFSGMARAVLHSSDYESVDTCKKAIDRHFEERNQHFKKNSKRAGNKIWGNEQNRTEFSESNNCKDPRYR
jgi:transposase